MSLGKACLHPSEGLTCPVQLQCGYARASIPCGRWLTPVVHSPCHRQPRSNCHQPLCSRHSPSWSAAGEAGELAWQGFHSTWFENCHSKPGTWTVSPQKSTVCYSQSLSCTSVGAIDHAGIEVGCDLVDLLPGSKLLLTWQRPYKGETGSLLRLLNREAGFVDTGRVTRFADVIERTSINGTVLWCSVQVVVNELAPL